MLFLELGNSTIKLAERHGESWRLETFSDADHVAMRLQTRGEEAVALAAPARRDDLDLLRKACSIREIERHHVIEFASRSYETLETLGLDRLLNLLGLDRDAVAISCGTAITVDAVVDGVPRFGAIMPGFQTAAEGLHTRINALPLIDPLRYMMRRMGQATSLASTGLPARSSEESVWNGVVRGTACGALALAGELWRSCGRKDEPDIVLTGGDARMLQRLQPTLARRHVDEALLFRGMERVASRV